LIYWTKDYDDTKAGTRSPQGTAEAGSPRSQDESALRTEGKEGQEGMSGLEYKAGEVVSCNFRDLVRGVEVAACSLQQVAANEEGVKIFWLEKEKE
jgi:hypothetical protein